MTRLLGVLGFGGGFLIISPKLRECLTDNLSLGMSSLDRYQPYSYIGLGLALLGAAMLYLYRCSLPR